jgi:hypothetical protein
MNRLLSLTIIGLTALGLAFASPAVSQAQTPVGVQVGVGPVGIRVGGYVPAPVYPVAPCPVVVPAPAVVYSPAYPAYPVGATVIVRPGYGWRYGPYYYGHWRR